MDAAFIDIIAAAFKGVGWALCPLLLLPLATLIFSKPKWLHALAWHGIEIGDGLSYGVGEIIKWALPLLVIVVALSVIGLSIFGMSYTKLDELPLYLHASLIMLGSSATLLAGQHVRVDIFHSRFDSRGRALIDLIGFYALAAPVCLTIIWMSQGFVSGAWQSLEGSAELDGIRGVFLLQTLLPAFGVLMLVQSLAIALRAVKVLRGVDRPKRPEHIGPLYGETHNPISGANSETPS